ncbi:hypothetical protein HAHE_02010 [Haloferula helveola]|uniref:Transcriptional regulator LacI/GalR-like sensor domain-containing protein n=1 Tax=Haloferula helveola TaxID=490095 RepID=A0ABM7RAA0_9BACT|nr:hypothetical protein HAHE_02010 [Haloferula helveola]
MRKIHILTAAEQAANHLRDEIQEGRIGPVMPGVITLEQETGVNRNTLEAGLRILEREGLIASQGTGRRRKIIDTEKRDDGGRSIRLAMLEFDEASKGESYVVEMRHRLEEAGHRVLVTRETLQHLAMNASRVAQLVARTQADAWIVGAGSRDVISWFSRRPFPTFCVFGRRRGLPIAGAGPDKTGAMRKAVSRLAGLGHVRIVLLTRTDRRLPVPGASETAFLESLEEMGIAGGDYNLPSWEDHPEDFQRVLNSLFAVSPPTAIIVDTVELYLSTQQFLLKQGLAVPRDVSLVCTDSSPVFDWCQPRIAHIHWDTRPLVRRVVRWAANVSKRRRDLRQSLIRATLVEGGTIAPAPGRAGAR